MINTFTYITNDYHLLSTKSKYPDDNFLISFRIDNVFAFEKLSLDLLHNSPFLSKNNISFSLYFNFNNFETDIDSLSEAILNHKNTLLQYFFHPKYKKINQKPILFFNESSKRSSKISELISYLDKILINQGYKGVSSVYFNEEYQNEKLSNVCFSSTQSMNLISDIYLELLKNQFYSSKYIGIKSKNIDETMLYLKAVESKLLKENPSQYYQLEKFNQLEKSNRILSEELELVTFDLQNQKIYLDFFKNQDEAIKINEFYQNEYEILPLWYKKLGHIVKVITGKRTFRSLFDNNVKKYKN